MKILSTPFFLLSINNGTLGYYHTDEHGNVSAISDVDRNVVADYDFDAFGNETVSTDAYYNPMRYCGEYYDDETGFIYLRARYYDPSIGRFISEDPHWNLDNMIYGDKYNEGGIKYPDSEAILQANNLYVYCANNPNKYVDSNGESYAATWGGTMWWLIGTDGPLPIGDAVFIGGTVIAAVADGVRVLYKKSSKSSGKEKANDTPSWSKGKKPKEGESGKDFAERLCDEKYGKNNYDKGPGSDYNKLKKYGDRGGKQ